MSDLFTEAASVATAASAPLADRMRPRSLDEVVGQEHLTAQGSGSLAREIALDEVSSMLLTGPPGSGKTTLARLLATGNGYWLEELSAVACGLADIRRVVDDARLRLGGNGQRTILFLDEIHRFNRAQQDALLPHVEHGVVTLVGATTENPYVSMNRALLSRLVVHELRALTPDDIGGLVTRAVASTDRGMSRSRQWSITEDARDAIVRLAGGDARAALTLVEAASRITPAARDAEPQITADDVRQASDRRAIRYDRAGDGHYDTISAYIKSMRAGDVKGAMRFLATMIQGGEDPMFIARRLAIFAAEDVGNGDPQALVLAHAAIGLTERIGLPECRIILAQVTRHCAEAPKDRTAIDDIDAATADVREHGSGAIPPNLTNRPHR